MAMTIPEWRLAWAAPTRLVCLVLALCLSVQGAFCVELAQTSDCFDDQHTYLLCCDSHFEPESYSMVMDQLYFPLHSRCRDEFDAVWCLQQNLEVPMFEAVIPRIVRDLNSRRGNSHCFFEPFFDDCCEVTWRKAFGVADNLTMGYPPHVYQPVLTINLPGLRAHVIQGGYIDWAIGSAEVVEYFGDSLRGHQAGHVFVTAPCAAQWMQHFDFGVDVSKSDLIELGASTGVMAMVALKRGFKEVVSTDYIPTGSMQRVITAALSVGASETLKRLTTGVVDVYKELPLPYQNRTFDIVLAINLGLSCKPVIETATKLVKRGGVVLITCTKDEHLLEDVPGFRTEKLDMLKFFPTTEWSDLARKQCEWPPYHGLYRL